MPVQRPRVLVKLFVPNVGTAQQRTAQEGLDDVTQLTVRAHRVELEFNNIHEADAATIVGAYDDLGIDPRFMRNAEGYIYMDDSADGNFQCTPQNLRFVGIAVDVRRALSPDDRKVHIRLQDYTVLFLNHKGGYPPDGVPTYQDTLVTAWQRVCDHTGYFDLATKQIVSTVQRLRDRIEFVGVDGNTTLGGAVSDRLARLGRLQTDHCHDAWAVWQTAVGSLGLISFICGDRCIVTTATDFYTANAPPRLIFGENVHEIEESRDQNALSGKNVGLFAYNALTHKTLEAYYPPLEDVTPKGKSKKKLAASALGPGVVVRAQDYEIFDYPYPVTDQATLNFCAQRVWEERSRQELKGKLKTAATLAPRMTPAGVSQFNLLGLKAGDRIRVEIDRQALTVIQRLPSIQSRVTELRNRGYSEQMANYIASNLSDIVNVSPEFQVHSVRITLDIPDLGSAEFEIEIDYLNRIETSGSAQPGTGTRTPPFSSQ